MKSILLASTALIGMAGAAAAEVIWAADAEFGYNEEVENGFYFAGGLGVTASAELDMGLEAGVSMDVDLKFDGNTFEDNTFGQTFSNIEIDGSDFVIFVRTQDETSGLYIGDTATASEIIWMGTTNMETDGFLEVGDVDDGPANGDFVDGVMRGDIAIGPATMSISYFLADDRIGESSQSVDFNDQEFDGLDGMQIGAMTTFGSVTVGAVYQEAVNRDLVNGVDSTSGEDGIEGTDDDVEESPGSIDELFGVYAQTSAMGADVTIAYSDNLTTDASSLGIEVSYPFGPVVATAFYSLESGPDGDDDSVDDNYGIAMAYDNGPISATAYFHGGGDEELGIEGAYTMDNGLVVRAGYIDNRDDIDENTEYYVGASYGFGDGAEAFVTYGDVGDGYTGALDEIGNAYETNLGTTIGVSFTF